MEAVSSDAAPRTAERIGRRRGIARPTDADVIVIGAGAAGKAAARTLHDLGTERVIVLEARARPDGRIHTNYRFGRKRPLEFGAEFIHGSDVATMPWVTRYGLTLIKAEGRHFDYGRTKTGQLVEQSQSIGDLMDELRQHAREHVQSGKSDVSVDVFLGFPKIQKILKRHGDVTPRFVQQFLRNDFAADPENLSVNALAEVVSTGYGANYRIGEGYRELLRRIAEGIDLRLSSPVKHIKWQPGHVEIRTRSAILTAHKAIVTLPLGVLQADAVEFDPPLPREVRAGIDQLGVGNASKAILRFTRPVWPKEMMFLSTAMDSQIWWPTNWGLLPLPPMLTCLIAADATQRFNENACDDVPTALVLQLQHIFRRKQVVPAALGGQIKYWGDDPYSRGGYSYTPVGTDPLIRSMLAQPIANTVYLAGEAFNANGNIASVHGAIESGVTAAQAAVR